MGRFPLHAEKCSDDDDFIIGGIGGAEIPVDLPSFPLLSLLLQIVICHCGPAAALNDVVVAALEGFEVADGGGVGGGEAQTQRQRRRREGGRKPPEAPLGLLPPQLPRVIVKLRTSELDPREAGNDSS